MEISSTYNTGVIEPQWLLDLRTQRRDLDAAVMAGKISKEWNEEADYLRKKIRELGAEPIA